MVLMSLFVFTAAADLAIGTLARCVDGASLNAALCGHAGSGAGAGHGHAEPEQPAELSGGGLQRRLRLQRAHPAVSGPHAGGQVGQLRHLTRLGRRAPPAGPRGAAATQ